MELTKREYELTLAEQTALREIAGNVAATRERHLKELATAQGEMNGAVRLLLRQRGIKDCNWNVTGDKLITEVAAGESIPN